jgi:hypothetical protein
VLLFQHEPPMFTNVDKHSQSLRLLQYIPLAGQSGFSKHGVPIAVIQIDNRDIDKYSRRQFLTIIQTNGSGRFLVILKTSQKTRFSNTKNFFSVK